MSRPAHGGGVAADRLAAAGFWILVASEAASVVVSLCLLARPSILPDAWQRPDGSEVLVRAWATTWLALSAVLLAVLLTSFRRAGPRERLVMVAVPAVWLSHALLAPGTGDNLALALVTAGALVATLRPRRVPPPA